jgi:hypothetical protein
MHILDEGPKKHKLSKVLHRYCKPPRIACWSIRCHAKLLRRLFWNNPVGGLHWWTCRADYLLVAHLFTSLIVLLSALCLLLHLFP